MNSPVWVYFIGLAGMGIYGLRILIQWYKSEKSHQVENPGIYWVLSSAGAIVLYIYGWLRRDFSIIFGESVGYYIYMWNIGAMGMYRKVPKVLVALQALVPVVILTLIIWDFPAFKEGFLHNEYVPLPLLVFGVLAQFIYEIRSVYQLLYSYRRKQSFLPLGHWVLAVIGSTMIIAYGIIRHDWVLAIGQFSIVFSVRNLMLSVSDLQRSRRNIPSLLLVRPARFGFNLQTAVNNPYQKIAPEDWDIQSRAAEEFDGLVRAIRAKDIPVRVIQDSSEPLTPDSIYPNNWISSHPGGTLVLYPMFSENRRKERKPAIVEAIRRAAGAVRTLDLTGWEKQDRFLEGTGSMVLDRKSKIAYACISPRTSVEVLNDFCAREGFVPFPFEAVDRNGMPIYHTNLMMSVGTGFAVLCREAFISQERLGEVEASLKKTGKTIVDISLEQVSRYAGNILEVYNRRGKRFVLMSEAARNTLREDQLRIICADAVPVYAPIPTIEHIGGGSARCMVAELFSNI